MRVNAASSMGYLRDRIIDAPQWERAYPCANPALLLS